MKFFLEIFLNEYGFYGFFKLDGKESL